MAKAKSKLKKPGFEPLKTARGYFTKAYREALNASLARRNVVWTDVQRTETLAWLWANRTLAEENECEACVANKARTPPAVDVSAVPDNPKRLEVDGWHDRVFRKPVAARLEEEEDEEEEDETPDGGIVDSAPEVDVTAEDTPGPGPDERTSCNTLQPTNSGQSKPSAHTTLTSQSKHHQNTILARSQ
jgi:hypothetical protein